MVQRPHSTVHRRRPTREEYLRRRIAVFGGAPLVLALVIFAFVAGLSGSSPSPKTRTTSPPTSKVAATTHRSGVGLRSYTFDDTTRKTYNYTTGSSTPGRKITVELRYPAIVSSGATASAVADSPIAKRKAYPLIVFAPGYRLRPEDYANLLNEWVHAGFLVAAVEFPDTTFPASDVPYAAQLPHGIPEGDIYNEPADVAFALAGLTKASTTPGLWLNGLIDTHEIALAGHSDGGSVVAALTYDASVEQAGLSVRAVAVLSGAEFAISNQVYGQPTPPVPLLVVQSAADMCAAPDGAVQLYNAIGSPKYFDELTNANHLGAFSGTNADAFRAVADTTITFFDSAFGIDKTTSAQLTTEGTVKGIATVVSDPTMASIPTPPGATVCPSD